MLSVVEESSEADRHCRRDCSDSSSGSLPLVDDFRENELPTIVSKDTSTSLCFVDADYKDTLLARLSTLRRNRELCDVILFVGGRELYAHRVVLAAVSSTLYELLTSSSSSVIPGSNTSVNAFDIGNQRSFSDFCRQIKVGSFSANTYNKQRQYYVEFPDVDTGSFEAIIHYAYTGRLQVSRKKVAEIFKLSSLLRIEPCARASADFLVQNLSISNCIGIRKSANYASGYLLANPVDDFIQKNFKVISEESKEFTSLPYIEVEVLQHAHSPLDTEAIISETMIGEKVLDWIRQQVVELPEHIEFRMDLFTERPHLLYFDDDFVLRDCFDVDDTSTVGSCDFVQDYKKSTRRCPKLYADSNSESASVKSPASSASTNSLDSLGSNFEEIEWKLVAITKKAGKFYIALIVVRRQLCAVSIHLIKSARNPSADVAVKLSDDTSLAKEVAFYPLANLTVPRCSCGVVEMDGRIIAFGGYNRGECLSSVEQYDPRTNVWTSLPPMLKGRGRFDAALCGGKIYVVGGSDGNSDLDTVECFDPDLRSWGRVASLSSPRSNIGLATIGNCLYSIGGWDGEHAVRDCEKYDPATNRWVPISSLLSSRSQSGCVVWKNKIYVAGGYDSWHCANTVEVYDPEVDTWHYLSPMNCARRGCGLAVFRNKLYAVGGSDGVESLCTSEWLDLMDPHSSWRPAPSMNTCRANVRVAVVADKLFAFGGFNGKSFLNSMEYLSEDSTEWRKILSV